MCIQRVVEEAKVEKVAGTEEETAAARAVEVRVVG